VRPASSKDFCLEDFLMGLCIMRRRGEPITITSGGKSLKLAIREVSAQKFMLWIDGDREHFQIERTERPRREKGKGGQPPCQS
jgi:hypothetical protein